MLGYLKGNWRFLVKLTDFVVWVLRLCEKYELHIEIWGSLENSIMLDYNFMSLCDNIEIFLTSLQKLSHIFISNARNSYTAHYSTFNQSTNRSRISAKPKKQQIQPFAEPLFNFEAQLPSGRKINKLDSPWAEEHLP